MSGPVPDVTMNSMERVGLVLMPLGVALSLVAKVLATVRGGQDPGIGLGLLLLVGLVLMVTGICRELLVRGRQGRYGRLEDRAGQHPRHGAWRGATDREGRDAYATHEA